MRHGKLKEPVTIQRQVMLGTRPGLGGQNTQWQTWIEPFAEMISRRGKEQFDTTTRQRYSEVVYHFNFAFDDVRGINAKMRILDEFGSIYEIRDVNPDLEDREFVLVECTLQDSQVTDALLEALITDEIPNGTNGGVYGEFTVGARGGSSPYTFAVASGALPAGMTIDTSTGLVSGTPTQTGDFSVAFSATDSEGDVHVLPEVTITIS